MATPSLTDHRSSLRCGRTSCSCRLPGAMVHCPACDDPRPTLTVAIVDGVTTLTCRNGCDPNAPSITPAADSPRRLDSLAPQALTWLWPGFVPSRGLTLLMGAPGVGTSWLALDLAARLSADGAAVLIVTTDDPTTTVLPRLDAQGAELSRVYLTDRVAALAPAIRDTRARLVIVDPIEDLTTHHNSRRQLLITLAHTAARTGTPLLALTHQPHRDVQDALRRATARPTPARSLLVIADDPSDQDANHQSRLLLTAKSPGSPNRRALPFRIAPPSGDAPYPRLVLSAARPLASVLHPPRVFDRPDPAVVGASHFLLGMLRDGPRRTNEVKQAAREAGISNYALYKGRLEADLHYERENTGGRGNRGRGAWYLCKFGLGLRWEENRKLVEVEKLNGEATALPLNSTQRSFLKEIEEKKARHAALVAAADAETGVRKSGRIPVWF